MIVLTLNDIKYISTPLDTVFYTRFFIYQCMFMVHCVTPCECVHTMWEWEY